MTQYQKELNDIVKNGGDVKKFKDEWFNRAVDTYRKEVSTEKDIHDFRSGKIHIK